MINAIKAFFTKEIEHNSQDHEHQLQVACAALMIEVARVDLHASEQEMQKIRTMIQASFSLEDQALDQLIELADQEAKDATDDYQFTSLIKKQFTDDERAEFIERLWKVAYADQVIDPHEEHIIRRVADLLYVPHERFMAAKHRVIGQ